MDKREREKEACAYVGGGPGQVSFSFNSIFFPGPLIEGGLAIKSEEHALNWRGRCGHALPGEVSQLGKTEICNQTVTS